MLGTDIMRCPKECGLIVGQRDMLPFTEAIARELYADIDRHEVIPPTEPDSRTAVCPGCSGTMQGFGYLESRFAWLDRCKSCQVIWIDRDELDTVVKLAAKNVKQHDRQLAERRELNESLTRLVWVNFDDKGFLAFRQQRPK